MARLVQLLILVALVLAIWRLLRDRRR